MRRLDANSLSGTIPFEIQQLSAMRFFLIEGAVDSEQYEEGVKALSGTIPTQIGDLKNLLIMDFNFNYLTGNVSVSHFYLPLYVSNSRISVDRGRKVLPFFISNTN